MLSLAGASPLQQAFLPAHIRKMNAQALERGVIRCSTMQIPVCLGVHFSIDRASEGFLRVAAEAGLTPWDALREAEYFWRFMRSPGDGEDYPLDCLPVDFHGARTAGAACGLFAAHVYRTEGAHEVALFIHLRGALYVARTTINVDAQPIPAERTALVDPLGDFATDAPGHGAAFTALEDAIPWLLGGTETEPRRLLLRRGATIPYRGRWDGGRGRFNAAVLPPNARIGAFGFGARPVVRMIWDDGALAADGRPTGMSAFGISDSHVSTAGQSAFAYSAPSPVVYVDGRRVGFTRDAPSVGMLTLDAPATAGARVLVINGNPVSGLAAAGGVVWVLSSGCVLEGVELLGGYDMAFPPTFDFDDLTTFNHACMTEAIHGGGYAENVVVLDCRINGFNKNVEVQSQADLFFAVNCDLSHWGDYGFYGISGVGRMCLVGCRIMGPENTVNNLDGKAGWNTPGVPSTADHGAIRTPSSMEMVINRCALASRHSWTAGGEYDDRMQPVARLAQSNARDQSYSFTESETIGGSEVFGGGPANAFDTLERNDIFYIGYNIVHMSRNQRRVTTALLYYTTIGNVFIAYDCGRDEPVSFLAGSPSEFVAAPDIRTEQCLSINDTFIALGDRPTSDLRITTIDEIQKAGVTNVLTRVTVSAAAAAQGHVDADVTALDVIEQNGYWRIWRKASAAAADVTATADATWSARKASYELRGDALSAFGAVIETDAQEKTLVDVLRITPLGAPPFVEGEELILTREQILTDRETFPVNNRAKPLVRPSADLVNPLIVVGGTWNSVTLREEDGPLDATAIKALSPEALTPLDGFFRPLPGSAALNAPVSQSRSWRVIGGVERAKTPSPGALDATTPICAAPLYQRPKVVLDLPAPLTSGQTVSLADVRLVGSDAGSPALTLSDIDHLTLTVRRAGATLPAADSYVLEAYDMVEASGLCGHPLLGLRRLASNRFAREDPFTPRWRRNSVDGGVTTTGVRIDGTNTALGRFSGNFIYAFKMKVHTLPTSTVALVYLDGGAAALFFGSTGFLSIRSGGVESVVLSGATAMRAGDEVLVFARWAAAENGTGRPSMQMWCKKVGGAWTTALSGVVTMPDTLQYLGGMLGRDHSLEEGFYMGEFDPTTPWPEKEHFFDDATDSVLPWTDDLTRGLAGLTPRIVMIGEASLNGCDNFGDLTLSEGALTKSNPAGSWIAT
jgi:hypothetical protein